MFEMVVQMVIPMFALIVLGGLPSRMVEQPGMGPQSTPATPRGRDRQSLLHKCVDIVVGGRCGAPPGVAQPEGRACARVQRVAGVGAGCRAVDAPLALAAWCSLVGLLLTGSARVCVCVPARVCARTHAHTHTRNRLLYAQALQCVCLCACVRERECVSVRLRYSVGRRQRQAPNRL